MIFRARQLPAKTYDLVPEIEHLAVMTGAPLSVLPASFEEELSPRRFAIRRPTSVGTQGNVLENVPLMYRSVSIILYCRLQQGRCRHDLRPHAVCPATICRRQPSRCHSPDSAATGGHADLQEPAGPECPGRLPLRYDCHDRWMLRIYKVNDPIHEVPLVPHQPFIIRA